MHLSIPPWVQKIIVDTCNFSVASSIDGPSNACPFLSSTTGATYNILVSNASGYSWSSTTGITLTSINNNATAIFSPGFTSGVISVIVDNGCGGNSITRSITVTATPPPLPGGITGPTTNYCINVSPPYSPATYSIQPVGGASSYLWTTSPGASIVAPGDGTSVQVNFTPSFPNNGTVCVQAISPACGSSAVRCTQPINRIPASIPSLIQGPTDVCSFIQNGTTATYSVNASPNVINEYAWSVTGNAIIPTNQVLNGNSIMISFLPGFTTGTISVVAINGCGTSQARNLNVSKNPPLPPVIIGEEFPCGGSTAYTYSIPTMPGIINYHWDVGSIGTIVSGQGTTTVGIQFNTGWSSGNVRVQAFSDCGSSIRYKPVTNGNCSKSVNLENVIYPNPSNGYFTIKVKNKKILSKVLVEIFNEIGVVVLKLNKLISNGKLVLDLQDRLQPGVYQVQCTINNEKLVSKLIITK